MSETRRGPSQLIGLPLGDLLLPDHQIAQVLSPRRSMFGETLTVEYYLRALVPNPNPRTAAFVTGFIYINAQSLVEAQDLRSQGHLGPDVQRQVSLKFSRRLMDLLAILDPKVVSYQDAVSMVRTSAELVETRGGGPIKLPYHELLGNHLAYAQAWEDDEKRKAEYERFKNAYVKGAPLHIVEKFRYGYYRGHIQDIVTIIDESTEDFNE